MTDKKEQRIQRWSASVPGTLLRLGLILAVSVGLVFAATDGSSGGSLDDNKLKNGSFEDGPSFSGTYDQPAQGNVPYWNTTAYQGKIELFKSNSNTYISGVKLTPTDGTYAAELNADEESTLYQNVKTTPSSVYEWGLDHGARNGKDIMALVIGPKQTVNPSKPSKAGRDQLMQMVDWLKLDVDKITTGTISSYKVYSKKFAANGTFADNAGNNAFSLTPSTIYTEEWHIWIMASSRATSGENPWNSYGSNAEKSAENTGESGTTNDTETASDTETANDVGTTNDTGTTATDLNKYYHYTVPSGQTDTLFGFVSVGYVDSPTTADKAKTYGNFLDNINFQIYHPLSGSSTNHGSGVVGGSDGTTEGEGGSEGHKVTVDDNLATYVKDGEPLKVQAVVKSGDAGAGCEFVGVYYTIQGVDGNPVTKFLQKAGNEIEDTGNLTDEQKKEKWLKSTNDAGDIVYTYYLDNITSPTDLHFIFIKSPTITYDSNGGKLYVVERTYNTTEAKNVYSFKPAVLSGNVSTDTGAENELDAVSGATPDNKPKETFISPYVSKAAEGQNDGWKFMGWLLTGDTVTLPEGITIDTVNKDQLGTLVLPAVHTVACNYSISGATGETAAQYFKILSGNVSLDKNIIYNDSNEISGVLWKDNGEERAYANVHKGLTMVAQWRWLQAFIPQVFQPNAEGNGGTYENSAKGGTVEITSVTDTSNSNENYNDQYVPNDNETYNGGKSYHAETDETITVKATAEKGYIFEGWYDASGKLVTTNTEYSYTETKESVNTYYARFSNSVTQTYIRQVKEGNSWKDTEKDAIGTLGRYTYTDAPGTPISSTATAGAGYKFVGWYDSNGNKVAESMLINDGATISYNTEKDATYYARFETAYTVKFVAQTKQANGTFKTDNVGGKVSVASVTDVNGAIASSEATKNLGAKFLGWYDKDGNPLSTDVTYSTNTTPDTNNVTYYARFEIVHNPTIENKAYLSFIAESAGTQIPSAFEGRDAGTGKNAKGYGLDSKFGNTISTGFKYSIGNMTNVSTIQIDVTVPASAYVKVGGTGKFTGSGNTILTDGAGVQYNKGSIQQISGATTLQYYWDASGLQANTTYGFVIDNLYAPGATATITVNGKAGTKVTNDNGVVNTDAKEYRGKSHYPQ